MTKKRSTILAPIAEFIALESAGGILLFLAALAALVLANSPLAEAYGDFLQTRIAIQIDTFDISKPLLLWINDGLMAIFFFLIGLEIKREVMDGELSSISQVIFPGLGALGGVLVPALIYYYFNSGDALSLKGWAIPMATDIAFALALLNLFGKRVPSSLKIFLLTLAIFDDLAAIVVIAVFYTSTISSGPLLVGALALAAGVILNCRKVTYISAYVLLGVVLWVAILKSGVHATLAGVLIAFCIPMKSEENESPLRTLEHDLHTPVALAVLPIFAFANAGVSLSGLSIEGLTNGVTLGTLLGLLVGKPVGIMLVVGLGVAIGLVKKPANISWLQLLGVAVASGIGFTMSLFIAGLAFKEDNAAAFDAARLGIIVGSLLAALFSYALLRMSLPKSE